MKGDRALLVIAGAGKIDVGGEAVGAIKAGITIEGCSMPIG